MPNYIKFNFEYDKQPLLDTFNNVAKSNVGFKKANKAILDTGSAKSSVFDSFFQKCPFVPRNDLSLTLIEFTGDSIPRTDIDSNGHVIFPLGGDVSLKNYEFKFSDPTSTWAYAIKRTDVLTQTMLNDIESTLIETVAIDGPTAIDGQTTHSFQTAGAIVLILKIPLSVSWDDVVTALSS